VLMVMVDGWRSDMTAVASLPTIESMWPDSAYSLQMRVEDTTISGSGQSTFVTGVHRDKHGIDDNSFSEPDIERYPYWFQHLREVAPEKHTAAYHTWTPMFDYVLMGSAGADIAERHDYTSEDADEIVTEKLVEDLATHPMDAVVLMLSDVDTAGHAYGFHPSVEEYVASMEDVDSQLGRIMAAIEARPTRAEEDWMVILSTDHGGTMSGHGSNIPEHRLVPLFVWGDSAVPGPIWPAPDGVDIVATALTHMGVEIRPEWGLDGRPVGISATEAPTAALDTNLIFNGDAEHERGYAGFIPDAAIPGWSDEGWMTIIAYDTPDFLLSTDAGPEERGDNYFCGGDAHADSVVHQTIDLSALSDEIDTGEIGYRLGAWLGGYSSHNDRMQLSVSFMDAVGTVILTDTIGPATNDDRDDTTSLVEFNSFGMVPSFVRTANVQLDALQDSWGNDGYGDNLELVLTSGK